MEPSDGARERAQPASHRVWPALAFFILVSAAMLGPHLVPPDRISRITYVDRDAYIFMWDFWWTKQAVAQAHNPYWTDLLNHPAGTSLAFHSYPLTYSLLSLPFQLALPGVTGLVVGLNATIFLSFVLGGLGAYLLAYHVTGSRPGAFVAGLIFAFMPFHVLNMVNLHVLAVEVLPFYVLLLLRLEERPTLPRSLGLGLCLALAYYTSLEYALYLVVFSAGWLLYRIVAQRAGPGRALSRGLATAAGCFLVLAAPLLWLQASELAAGENRAERDLDELLRWSPALVSWVTPSRFHPLYGEALAFAGEFNDGSGSVGMRTESTLGWTVLALALFSLRGLRRDLRGFWAAGALGFLILSLGPYLRLTGRWLTGIPLPYLVLYLLVPPLRAGRDPTRFVALAMLMLAVLAAFGVRDLLQRLPTARSRLRVAVLIGALVLFEDLTFPPGKLRPAVHPLYETIARTPGDVAIIDLTREPDKLLPQTVHGKPLTLVHTSVPRAASGTRVLGIEAVFRSPDSILRADPAVLPGALRMLREEMARDRIRFVVFPADGRAEARERLARAAGARVTSEGGLVVCDFGPPP